jgi:raffinose/stachyose/melibiose transport system substrate-binding protein
MLAHKTQRSVMAAIAGIGVIGLALTGCSAGGGAEEGGPVTLSVLIDNTDTTLIQFQALADAFTADHPDVTFDFETRPGGGDGDNIIKTRLATGEMNDVFLYNSGSLFQAIAPEQNLVPLDDSITGNVIDTFFPTVSAGGNVYGVPFGTAMGGGILYNIPIYEELGLEIPKTWDDFIANNDAIKAAGKTAVIQTYKDTWTSQLFVLGDFANVLESDPDWADKYTANERKYATDDVAIAGFDHLAEVFTAGYSNADFGSATFDDGVRMVATGEGAHYPMLSFAVSNVVTNYPDNVNDVGFFAIPGTDAASNPLTTWMPAGIYIPKTTEGAKLTAAQEFLAFIATTDGADVLTKAVGASGPYLITGATLPDDVPQAVKDMLPYFEADGGTLPALEFLSPIKGPALEQITVAVGSGITSAKDGASQYDVDVEKQAQQLGLEGW